MKTSFRRSTRGQGLVEYALLIGLLAIVAIVAVSSVGSTIQTAFYSRIVGTLSSVAVGAGS